MSWRDVLPVHPAADLFPLMSESELRELGEDIKKNGLREPIAIHHSRGVDSKKKDCRLLDGRNRLDAMELVGIEFEMSWVECDGRHYWDMGDTEGLPNPVVRTDDPYAYVISANIHRRHSPPSRSGD